MNFVAEEYDAGASIDVIQLASRPRLVDAFKAEERHCPRFDLELNVIKCLSY
jgi:hypothetical protein